MIRITLLFISLFVFSTASALSPKLKFEYSYSNNLKKSWIKYFSGRSKSRFLRQVRRGKKVEAKVRSVFRKHGIPGDLFFVGLIESGYAKRVNSHAGARGPWQFMKGTARNYGLKVNRYRDERTNLVKSTHAAARYLKDLYNIFGSWDLALCAYNSGEYRVLNAIRRGNTRNYRKLARRKLIPLETSKYIAKVAAARDLYYKYTKGKKFNNSSRRTYRVKRGDNLVTIARRYSISLRKLKSMNKLSKSMIHPGQKLIVSI